MFSIQNKNFIASFSNKGAELQSLISKEFNINYIWNGDASFWAKHSPVLFPIVGSLKNDTYYYNEKEYHLPRHGFARDKIFTVNQISETEIIFELQYSQETLEVFPFPFLLSIKYSLQEKELFCNYCVKNMGADDMYFSLGAHPAFAVPLINTENYNDYYLQFNNDEKLIRYKLEDGLISDKTEEILLQKNKLDLQHSLFYEDAIVLKNLKSNCISFKNKNNTLGFDFNFNSFPFFGIWAAKDAPFVCLEPWCGIADNIYTNQQFVNKEGINKLAANALWKRSWSVAIL